MITLLHKGAKFFLRIAPWLTNGGSIHLEVQPLLENSNRVCLRRTWEELDRIQQFKAIAKLGEFLEARFSQSL